MRKRGNRRIAAWLAVATLALSGLGAPAWSEEDGPSTLAWEVRGCDAVLAAIPVEAEALRPHLPEGFDPATPEEFGMPPLLPGDAVLGVKALDCEEGTTSAGSASIHYGAVWSPVHPPEPLRNPDLWFHFVAWDTLVPDDGLRGLMEERGLPVHDGEADLSGLTDLPQGFAFDVSMTMGGDAYGFQGLGPLPDSTYTGTAEYLDFMAGADGQLTNWRLTSEIADLYAGTGLVHLPAGSWTAEVAGGEMVPALILASRRVSFTDGTVTFPDADD